MPKFIDLTGQRFDRLFVLELAELRRPGGAFWRCQCDCGKIKIVYGGVLRDGSTRSCGCLMREVVAESLRKNRFKHGLSMTPEYRSWDAMRQRCLNPKHKNFSYYGGRGITICQRWLDDFKNFLTDMGPKPTPKHTLDRIDNDRGYEPTNCRWLTQSEQTRNYSRNRHITINGITKLVCEWSEETGIPVNTLRARLRLGKTPEQAISEPISKKNRNGLARDEMKRLREHIGQLTVELAAKEAELAALRSKLAASEGGAS